MGSTFSVRMDRSSQCPNSMKSLFIGVNELFGKQKALQSLTLCESLGNDQHDSLTWYPELFIVANVWLGSRLHAITMPHLDLHTYLSCRIAQLEPFIDREFD